MKKKKLILGVSMMLLCAVSFQSCIGSFSLTNKVLTWNRHVNNKFVNELVFFAFWFLPVYEVTAIADLLVINSIEFWSGNVPLESNNRIIETEDGNYLIAVNEKGYTVDSPDGNVLHFSYDSKSQMWSFSVNDGEAYDFLQYSDDDHVKIIGTNGEFVDVELSKDGIDSFKANLQQTWMALNNNKE
ncbi:MAG: DUF3332 domain-containing protein [Muribaculaceae bacterium]|nr:DUF3332 domain-containing protein [Muribaculaceae bacterium]